MAQVNLSCFRSLRPKDPSDSGTTVSLLRLTSMVERLSTEERSRLVLEVALATVFSRFRKTVLVKKVPVMRLDVDLEMSCISLMLDKSITDLEIFFKAEGVKLVSSMSRAASPSNKSGRCFGQI